MRLGNASLSLGAAVDGLGANEVAIFKQLQDQGKSLYFMGTRLLGSANNLPVNLRPLWTELIGVTAGPPNLGARFLVRTRAQVSNGAYGLIGEFSLGEIEPALRRPLVEQEPRVLGGRDGRVGQAPLCGRGDDQPRDTTPLNMRWVRAS